MEHTSCEIDINPCVLKCLGRLAFICCGWCDATSLDNSTVPSLLFAVSDAVGLVYSMLVSHFLRHHQADSTLVPPFILGNSSKSVLVKAPCLQDLHFV